MIGRLTRFLIGEAGFKQIKKRRRACGWIAGAAALFGIGRYQSRPPY